MRWSREGSSTIVALTFLILMASVAAGCALILQAVFAYTRHSADRDELRHILRKEGERVIKLIAADPTPNTDYPFDPVWTELTHVESPGVGVALQDVSSKLNANWVQKTILEKTALAALLRPGFTAQDLQQRREDKGISTDIAAEYGDLIKDEALSRYFTGYGYANLNTTDEFALRKLYEVRMGDPSGAEMFRTRWQQAMIQKKVLKRTDLREFLGLDYDRLFPVFNVEPVFNVYFLDPLVLSELLSFPDFKVPKPKQTAQLILDSRHRAELPPEELRRMIGVGEENPICSYLGVVTWFWRITVSRDATRLEIIVARLPSDDGSASHFMVTEERFFP
ncbi:MAG: hypothetical protein ACLQCB_00625 [Spirochaetia bacterium]